MVSDLSLRIAGKEYVSQLYRGSLTIDRRMTHAVDQCKFSVYAGPTGTPPQEGEEVLVIRDRREIVFGGIVVSATLAGKSDDRCVQIWDIDCDDYTALLDGKLVVETYEDMSASEIFLDIARKYIDGFTVEGVRLGAPAIEDTGPDLSYIRPSEAFKYLCDFVGWEWEPTYTKDLRFFSSEDLRAPAPIKITQDTPIELLKHSIDINGLRNRVYVQGGSMLSDTQELSWLTDGVERFWNLPWGPAETTLYLSGTQKSIGVENIHEEENFDFMMSFTEKYLKCSAHTPTPSQGEQFNLFAKQYIPVITVFEDIASQAAIKAIQGGDGIYEHSIVDTSLVTIQAAEAVAQADLAQHANPVVSGEFRTWTSRGWYPGQIVNINLSDRGIVGEYQIQRVRLERIGGPGESIRWIYTVTYGGRLLGLADFLRALVSRQQKDRGEETKIIQKIVFSDDTIAVSDSSDITPVVLPYRYGEARSIWGEVVLWPS